MKAEIFKAKKFQNRQDLDATILATVGDNLTLNRQAGHRIEGTVEELEKLSLSKYSTVYGVRVIIK